VLFHLAEPAALLGIILALLVGIFAHDAAQVGAARLAHDPLPARSGRLTGPPTTRVSPFSAVSMIIAGNGWAEPIAMNDVWRKRRFHVSAAILAGPLAYLVLTAAALGAYVAVSEPAFIEQGDRTIRIGLQGGFGAKLLLWMALTFASMFILSLVPVPPTDGGRVLFLLAPATPGWRNANDKLANNNIGVVILLAILLLPVLFTGFPSVVDQLVGPLLRGLASLFGLDLG
jgi:hypothetical protein